MPEYETFFAQKLREGEEFDVELIDRDTKEVFQARVRVARTQEALPGSCRLLARDRSQGNIAPREVWYVSILRRLEDEEPKEVRRREVPLEERKGYMLRSLIEERLKQGQDPRTHGV